MSVGGSTPAVSTIGVTVLFADLVDSTALASRLGAAGADALRRELFGLLRAPVAALRGREVKNLGDGIMAVFAGVGLALDAAVAMQRAIDRRNRATEGPVISVRVGLATGDCVEEHGDYFGEPVVRAARLCAAADGGQILALDIEQFLAPRGQHEFASVGELELKGLPERVAAVEVRWTPLEIDASGKADAQPAQAPVIPLPDRLSIPSPFGFVGRDDERVVLRNAWMAAESGERRIVLLSGEAGVGKTRVVTEFAREALDDGGLVLYGGCDEDVTGPYRPWIESLTHYFTHAGPAGAAPLGPDTLPELAGLIPVLRDGVLSGGTSRRSGDGDQYALYGAVTALLVQLSRSRPVMLLLDDLHGADRASLLLLRHVVAHVAHARLLIVGIFRDTDIREDHPLVATLASLHRETGVDRVHLDGLAEADVMSMIRDLRSPLEDADARQLAQALQVETGGNPFFVIELLRHLEEIGYLSTREESGPDPPGDLADLGLPQSVHDVVRARVRRLGDAAQRLLGSASVVGREFDGAVAAAVADFDSETALEILESATAAGLVDEVRDVVDRFSFTHALIQHVLYESLSNSRRVRLHGRAAESIERLMGDDDHDRVDELANHWFEAMHHGGTGKAIQHGISAGDRALEARSPDDAVHWYERTLDVIAESDSYRRCDVMIRIGDAQRDAGDARHRRTLLDAADLAQRIGADDLLVRAALANNRGWHSRTGEADGDRIRVLEAALVAEQRDSAERALLQALLAVELSSSGDAVLARRLALVDEAVEMARRVGDDATLAAVLEAGVFAAWIPDRLEMRLGWSEEAVSLAGNAADPVLAYWACARRDLLAMETQDVATFEQYRARQVALVDRLGQPVMRWRTTCVEATRVFLRGDLEGAEALAGDALELGLGHGQPDALSYYEAQLVAIRLCQGRVGEMEDAIRQQVGENPGIPSFRIALAGVCADSGRHREAVELLADDVATGFSRFPKDPMWLVNLTGAVRVAVASGLIDGRVGATSVESEILANALYDILAPWCDRVIHIDVLARPPVAYFLGQLAARLAREAEAEAHFSAALQISTGIGAPLFAAMTLIEWGAFRLDRGRGDPVEARKLVHDGLEAAVARRAGGIADRARAVLAGPG